jgi:hypothetical protein
MYYGFVQPEFLKKFTAIIPAQGAWIEYPVKRAAAPGTITSNTPFAGNSGLIPQ